MVGERLPLRNFLASRARMSIHIRSSSRFSDVTFLTLTLALTLALTLTLTPTPTLTLNLPSFRQEICQEPALLCKTVMASDTLRGGASG